VFTISATEKSDLYGKIIKGPLTGILDFAFGNCFVVLRGTNKKVKVPIPSGLINLAVNLYHANRLDKDKEVSNYPISPVDVYSQK